MAIPAGWPECKADRRQEIARRRRIEAHGGAVAVGQHGAAVGLDMQPGYLVDGPAGTERAGGLVVDQQVADDLGADPAAVVLSRRGIAVLGAAGGQGGGVEL